LLVEPLVMSEHLLTKEEVVRACDELHSRMDEGPGTNGAALADSLNTVRRLQAAASWDYPASLLRNIESQLAAWFSPASGGPGSRQTLLEHIARLEDAWERPRA
jgi:hypothetical protein